MQKRINERKKEMSDQYGNYADGQCNNEYQSVRMRQRLKFKFSWRAHLTHKQSGRDVQLNARWITLVLHIYDTWYLCLRHCDSANTKLKADKTNRTNKQTNTNDRIHIVCISARMLMRMCMFVAAAVATATATTQVDMCNKWHTVLLLKSLQSFTLNMYAKKTIFTSFSLHPIWISVCISHSHCFLGLSWKRITQLHNFVNGKDRRSAEKKIPANRSTHAKYYEFMEKKSESYIQIVNDSLMTMTHISEIAWARERERVSGISFRNWSTFTFQSKTLHDRKMFHRFLCLMKNLLLYCMHFLNADRDCWTTTTTTIYTRRQRRAHALSNRQEWACFFSSSCIINMYYWRQWTACVLCFQSVLPLVAMWGNFDYVQRQRTPRFNEMIRIVSSCLDIDRDLHLWLSLLDNIRAETKKRFNFLHSKRSNNWPF